MHLKIHEFGDWKVKGLWIVSITSQQNGNGNPAHRYEYTCKESNTRKRYIARKVISILLLDIILKNNYVACENGKIDEWSRYI